MKKPFALLAAFGSLVLTSAGAPELSSRQAATEILKSSAAPAVGVALIRNGRLAEECVLGVRARNNPAPVQFDDRWHIGSDAKAMTATMIARLVERGKLSWDTPLYQLIPELASSMRPDYRNVTLKDLLAHRAGLQDLIDSDFYESLYHDKRPLHAQRIDYVRMALSMPPAYPPGTDARYSNRGTVISALAAEDATGLSYEQLMQREVFGPLGMRTMTYSPAKPGELTGHEMGVPKYGDHSDNPRVDAPAGEIRLTLDDWAKFAIDQMEGERGRGRLLKPETYRLLHTGQVGTIYGLGWGVRPALANVNGRFLTHAGSNGNWYARIVLAPDTGNGMLIAANAGDGGVDKAIEKVEAEIAPTLVKSDAAPAALHRCRR